MASAKFHVELDMDTHKIVNVTDPTADQDAATKKYVDDNAGGGGSPTGAAGGVLSGTYPNPGFAADMATQAELDAHTGDTSAAHAASAISADSTTLVGTGTDVQAVLEELDNGIADHLADISDAHDASAISIVDTGGYFAGTEVEAALQALGAATGGTPVGFELDYAQITSPVTVSATAFGSATTIITGGTVSYDGSTKICIEVYTPLLVPAVDDFIQIGLFDITAGPTTTQIGIILESSLVVSGSATGALNHSAMGRKFYTPSSGSHQFIVKGIRGAANGTFYGEAGTTTTREPGYLRITKA